MAQTWLITLLSVLTLMPGTSALAQELRIKDLASLRGDRSNSLIGLGLVIGLNKTGDSAGSFASNKALANLLGRLGLPPGNATITSQAAAAVVVTADLPAFAAIGDRIDVRLSTLGDASSLAGGTLILTPLKAADEEVYAMAEGAIVVGQATGKGSRLLTVARISGGGVVERSFAPDLVQDGHIDLQLKQADFTTSHHMSRVINQHFRMFIAEAKNPALVSVTVPATHNESLMAFIAELEGLSLKADQKAVVVVNERTGTVVMGESVRILSTVVSHNGLSIQVGVGKDLQVLSFVLQSQRRF